MPDFRLYVILDLGILRDRALKSCRRIILAGADVIQLRAKGFPDRKIIQIGRAIKKLTAKSKALLIVNDRPDLSLACSADGVHLGQSDLPIKLARRIIGQKGIIGISTHSLAQAQEAQRQGADYIGLGPIFATETKPKLSPLTPRIISRLKAKINIPFVAIGGITLNNLHLVMHSGARRVAVCRAIICANDVAAATQEFKQRLKQ